MTEAPDKKGSSADNLPEPPLDELYQLYLSALAYDLKRMMPQAAAMDLYLEEGIAMIYQPKSKERFREYLEECTNNGTRACAVNCLVLGPEFCDLHPDDPRIQLPPEAKIQDRKQLRAALDKALSVSRDLGRGRS